jgi:type II secretory ATPase GspE/PulE/Tfp pilus assembly ATPase PilB-like protein
MPLPTLQTTMTLAESPMMLVSWWKSLFLLVALVPWAILVSKVYDKHAARFHLPRRKWNLVHMLVGVVAVAAFMLMPVKHDFGFLAAWFAMVAILAADLFVFAKLANKDDRVPERFRLRLDMDSFKQAKAEKEAAKLQAKVTLTIKGPDDKGKLTVAVPPPTPETPEFEVRIAAEELFSKAVEARASQLDLVPTGKDNTYGVSYLVDGVRQAGDTMPGANAIKLMDFWKSVGRLDTTERRRKQTAMVSVERDTTKKLVRVTTVGGAKGMQMTMLFDPEQAVTRKLNDLGLLDMQLAELKAIIQEEKGTVLLTSPADAGRTTTLYTIVRQHDAYTKNVHTVETEPQAALEGVRLNQFDAEKEGADFSTTVRSVLRRDPAVVAVADLPDANTAKEVAKADHDRTRTYVSLKGDSAMGAIQTWVKAVGDPKQGAAALHGVVAQRLLRRLCPNCRVAYPPPGEMLKKLGVPEGKVQQLFKKGGQVLIKNKPEVCPMCKGVGYQGQIGVFEVFAINAEEREKIAANDYNGLRAQFRKKGLPTLQQAAIRIAIDGVTSVEEVMRVTAEGGATPPAAGANGAPSKPSPQSPASAGA